MQLSIKDIVEKYSSPDLTYNVNNPKRQAYVVGYLAAGQRIDKIGFQLPKGGYSREIREPEPDMIESFEKPSVDLYTLAYK